MQDKLLTWTCFDSTNVVIILGMMQVSKKVPFEDPNVLNAVRGLYILSNLIIMGIYYYIKLQIDKKKGASLSFVPPTIQGLILGALQT